MGTFAQISCVSSNSKSCETNVEMAFQEMRRVESILSNFKADADIYRLNRTLANLIDVQKETLDVIEKAKLLFLASGGAFDITVAPILKIWGFYDRDNKPKSVPDEEIKKTLALVGSDNIIVDRINGKAGFKIPGMAVDLGAIGKGYAVDRAKDVLVKAGIGNALLGIAGDIYCLGGGRNDEGWKIGIRHPLKENEVIATLNLKNKAISTSGQYENFVEVGGKRYAHIINPKTGYPVENGLLSVTVVADDSSTADALATTVFVLGEEEGQELLKKFGAEAVLISKSDKGLRFLVTKGLKQNAKINFN